jgi:PAS domain S-box-containing protein
VAVAERKPVILNVDDDEANRYSVTRSLSLAGFDVTEAADGADALRRAAAERPDLIILDVRLPDTSGFEVCRRLKADPATRRIPVLHLSAKCVTADDAASGLDGGADAYLVRPVEPVVLAATVRALLRGRWSEDRLREAEARHRLILRNITDHAIYLTDPAGVVTDWFEGAERVKGYTRAEAVGQHVSMFFTPEQVAAGEVEREIAEAREHGRAEREGWRVRKGGERFWVNETLAAVRDADGALLGFTKISRDLTDRKRLEDALRAGEERLRLLVENIRDHAVHTLDPDGRVTSWNPGAERVFGYAAEEIVGRDFAAFFTPEDRARNEPAKELATAVAAGQASDDRWQVRKDGTRFWANGVTSAMRDAGGHLLGFAKVCRDQTAAKQLAEQRERLLAQERVARAEAERAAVVRDEFLAVVSHELRTPLSAILIWTKMLRAGAVGEGQRAEALATVEHSAEAQRQLIDDLLDTSQMLSGNLRLHVREVDPASIVEASLEAVGPMAEAKGVAVEASLDRRAGRVRLDPDRFRQVVWNLVNNAVKFTDKGGRVGVVLRREDGRLRVEVSDTGRGISREFLPHVFERFRQQDASTTRTAGGLGLGMAITRQLVELHGGSIAADSPGEGGGATFTVELPVADVRAKAGPKGRRPTRVGTEKAWRPSPVLAGLSVLLVEDEVVTRTAVRWLLEQCGARVTAVESADRAVAAFRESPAGDGRYDVLVCDVGLPGRDGYEVIREVREIEGGREGGRTMPAVALTAYVRPADRERALAAGYQRHIGKPVEPAELVATVAGLARRTDIDLAGRQ